MFKCEKARRVLPAHGCVLVLAVVVCVAVHRLKENKL